MSSTMSASSSSSPLSLLPLSLSLSITSLCLFLSVLPLTRANPPFSVADYGRWFHGDGTYYGYTDGGNCAFRHRPPNYRNILHVAINREQYADSLSCGACVKFTGNGRGAGANPIVGTQIGLVTDQCPECHRGSLDLSKPGDGRWEIKFTFVECPFEKDDVSFLFEGSHQWYWKVQVRGIKYPIRSVSANGVTGSRTQDNFYELQNSGSHRLPATIHISDIMGRTFKARIDRMENDKDIRPSSVEGPNGQVNSKPKQNPPPPVKKPQPTKNPNSRPSKCVPDGYSCGPNSWFGTSKCCGSRSVCKFTGGRRAFKCVKVQPKQCIRRGVRCTFRNGKRKNRPCCHRMRCGRRRGWRFRRCMYG